MDTSQNRIFRISGLETWISQQNTFTAWPRCWGKGSKWRHSLWTFVRLANTLPLTKCKKKHCAQSPWKSIKYSSIVYICHWLYRCFAAFFAYYKANPISGLITGIMSSEQFNRSVIFPSFLLLNRTKLKYFHRKKQTFAQMQISSRIHLVSRFGGLKQLNYAMVCVCVCATCNDLATVRCGLACSIWHFPT